LAPRHSDHIVVPPYDVVQRQEKEVKEKQLLELSFAWQTLGLDFNVDLGVMAFNPNGQMLDYLYFDKPSAIDGAITNQIIPKTLSQDFLKHGYDVKRPQSVDRRTITIDLSKLWETKKRDEISSVHTMLFTLSIFSGEASLLRVRDPHVVFSRLKPKAKTSEFGARRKSIKKAVEAVDLEKKRLFQIDFTDPISDKKSLLWFKIVSYERGYKISIINQPCNGQNILQFLPLLRNPEFIPVKGLDSCPDINSEIGKLLSHSMNYSNTKPLRFRFRLGTEKFIPPFGKIEQKKFEKSAPTSCNILMQFFSFDEVGYFMDNITRGYGWQYESCPPLYPLDPYVVCQPPSTAVISKILD
jgi:stress response protein SCP2